MKNISLHFRPGSLCANRVYLRSPRKMPVTRDFRTDFAAIPVQDCVCEPFRTDFAMISVQDGAGGPLSSVCDGHFSINLPVFWNLTSVESRFSRISAILWNFCKKNRHFSINRPVFWNLTSSGENFVSFKAVFGSRDGIAKDWRR